MIPEAIFVLPCPMCGTLPKGPTRMGGRFGPDWLIVCPSCQLKIERYSAGDAADDPMRMQIIEAWNRRADPAAGVSPDRGTPTTSTIFDQLKEHDHG